MHPYVVSFNNLDITFQENSDGQKILEKKNLSLFCCCVTCVGEKNSSHKSIVAKQIFAYV